MRLASATLYALRRAFATVPSSVISSRAASFGRAVTRIPFSSDARLTRLGAETVTVGAVVSRAASSSVTVSVAAAPIVVSASAAVSRSVTERSGASIVSLATGTVNVLVAWSSSNSSGPEADPSLAE